MLIQRRVVSVIRAAEIAGVSRRTIYTWLHAGKIEAVRTAGGALRIYEDTLHGPAGDMARAPHLRLPRSNHGAGCDCASCRPWTT